MEADLRRLFSEWHLDERAWIVAPFALWLAAFMLRTVVLMILKRRVISRGESARGMGVGWKVSFVAAVAWLVGWAVWLTVEG